VKVVFLAALETFQDTSFTIIHRNGAFRSARVTPFAYGKTLQRLCGSVHGLPPTQLEQ